MDLDEKQVRTLRIINCIAATFFAINLLFVLHNSEKYIYKLRIRKHLIIILYVFIFIDSICRIIACVGIIISPKHGFFEYISDLVTYSGFIA